MLGLNRVFIMGNLTRDPELKYTPNGQPVASFGMATNRRWNTPEGERREEAEFHNVVVWGKPAETINQYVKKGNPLFVEGRLKTQSWEGPDGVKRQRTEIIVENFQFLGGGQSTGNMLNSSNSNQSGGNFGQTYTPPVTAGPPIDNMPINNDDKYASGNNNVPNSSSDNPFADEGKGSNNPDDISIDDIPF